MSLNFVNAFTFVFKEKNWFAKILIGAILFFFIKVIQIAMDVVQPDTLPAFNFAWFSSDGFFSSVVLGLIYLGALILLAVSIWMHATSFGYIITTIGNYMKSEETSMPDWDDVVGCLFKRGFKFFIALFIISSALALLASATYVLFMFSMVFLSQFLGMILLLLGAFVTVYVCIISPALLLSFCENYRFIHALDFVRARQIALKSFGNYLLALLMVVVTFIFSIAIGIFFFHVKIGILVLPLICFYLFIVMGNFMAQYYKEYVAQKQ